MQIYTDVTNLLTVDFVSGIQRVVRELLVRLLQDDTYTVVPLFWDSGRKKFYLVDGDSFAQKLQMPNGDMRTAAKTDREWDFSASVHVAQSVFLDLDAVWINFMRRSYLYAMLKRSGYKVVTLIYDVIPLLYPQFIHKDTVFRFYNYFAACLKYADVLLTNTRNTEKDIQTLAGECGLPPKHVEIVPLGMDFAAQPKADEGGDVRPDAVSVASQGRYMLMVGTIEPRKNHCFLLDAFEQYLLDVPVNLVFAGRIGWNMQAFEERLRAHPLLGKRLFFIEKANDETIDYLYKHAFLFVCASIYEGFGLPVLEALGHGLPALVSDTPVFREVGGDACEYFPLDEPTVFADKVRNCLEDERAYEALQLRAAAYRTPVWDDAAQALKTALGTLPAPILDMPKNVEQIFILSARPDELMKLFPYIERYMGFIRKILVACPAFVRDELVQFYQGSIQLDFLTDEENLGNTPLPEDHETRNFLLRARAMRSPKLDTCFLMYDDDYRPLVDIQVSDYMGDDYYRAYYFYDLLEWQGDAQKPSSFDRGMYKTKCFLLRHGYPTLQYSSHMPQIIDKRIYLEMLAAHPGMEYEGYDEWSTYFNYAAAHYPQYFRSEVYKTLCWPGAPTDWDCMFLPREYLFENYYPVLYEKGRIFQDCADDLAVETERGKIHKILARHNQQMEREIICAVDRVLDQWYMRESTTSPHYILKIQKDTARLFAPAMFYGNKGFCKKIAIFIHSTETIEEQAWELLITYTFFTKDGKKVGNSATGSIAYGVENAQFPIRLPSVPGKYTLFLSGSLKKPAYTFEVQIPAWIYEV